MHPKRLTILGVGLLGGSIGLAVKSVLNSCHIIGYGHRTSTLEKAVEVGAIDEFSTDPGKSVAGSDLVILCTPVGVLTDLVGQIGKNLSDAAIVTDVGSTKASVVHAAETLLPKAARFVGSHPMAGSEKRGVEFARADLFRHAMCILTPTERTDASALKSVDDFWRLLGMRTTQLPPGDHDRLLADVSHLPHLVAAALVAMQHDNALDLAGKGFLDTTRIASGDGALWRDILLDNRANLGFSIARLKEQLFHLEHWLATGRGEDLCKWLDAASARRDALVHKKLRELNPD